MVEKLYEERPVSSKPHTFKDDVQVSRKEMHSVCPALGPEFQVQGHYNERSMDLY